MGVADRSSLIPALLFAKDVCYRCPRPATARYLVDVLEDGELARRAGRPAALLGQRVLRCCAPHDVPTVHRSRPLDEESYRALKDDPGEFLHYFEMARGLGYLRVPSGHPAVLMLREEWAAYCRARGASPVHLVTGDAGSTVDWVTRADELQRRATTAKEMKVLGDVEVQLLLGLSGMWPGATPKSDEAGRAVELGPDVDADGVARSVVDMERLLWDPDMVNVLWADAL